MTTDSKLVDKLEQQRVAQQTGQEVARKGEAPKNVLQLLGNDGYKRELGRVLADEKMADRMLRIALTICRTTPDLFECTMESFAGALLVCAQLKLEPGAPMGHAWILPFKDTKKRTKEATFVIGYPGVVQLAMRSGQMASIAARAVREGDDFDYDYGSNYLRHKPPVKGARGEAFAYYCNVHYANGGRYFLVMTRAEVEKHRDRYARSAQSVTSPWRSNFDEMAQKTTILQSRRYLPASADFIQATTADEHTALWMPGQQGAVVLDHEDFSYLAQHPTGELPEMSGPTDPATGEVTPQGKASEQTIDQPADQLPLKQGEQ